MRRVYNFSTASDATDTQLSDAFLQTQGRTHVGGWLGSKPSIIENMEADMYLQKELEVLLTSNKESSESIRHFEKCTRSPQGRDYQNKGFERIYEYKM